MAFLWSPNGNPQKGTPCHDITTNPVTSTGDPGNTPTMSSFFLFDHRISRKPRVCHHCLVNPLNTSFDQGTYGNALCHHVMKSLNTPRDKWKPLLLVVHRPHCVIIRVTHENKNNDWKWAVYIQIRICYTSPKEIRPSVIIQRWNVSYATIATIRAFLLNNLNIFPFK